MTYSSPNISVVICTYTEARWDEMVAAVESVQRQTAPPYQVIIVVDHNLRLLELARSRLHGVVVVENSEQRGLSGARNSGIAVAQGAIVAFIDDDAVAAPDWLTHLGAGYEDSRVLGVGGTIAPKWVEGQPRWFPEEFNWVVGCTYRGMPRALSAVRNLIGCNMSFRREVFEGVGGFRHEIGRVGNRPLGCEETELCIRAVRHWKEGVLLYEPRGQVHHRVPPTRGTWRYFRERCYAEGLSKAVVAQLVGSGDGLTSERSYTLRTLPQGIVRGLADAFIRLRPVGLARAGAITAGFVFTTTGYLRGRFSKQLANGQKTDASGVRSA